MGIGRAARSHDSSLLARAAPISLCLPTAQHGQSGGLPTTGPWDDTHWGSQEAGVTIQPGPQASAAQPTGQGVGVCEWQ